MDTNPLYVVIGCDVDPDRPGYGGTLYNAGRKKQVWNGIQCIPTLKNALDPVKDSNGRNVAITWLLRCDEQMNITEGSHSYLLNAFTELWKQCENSGDEIGWHPHFWRLDNNQTTWVQEIHDIEFQRSVLREGFEAFTEAWNKPPKSVRMGWDYHNNETLCMLSELGVHIDFSALPYQRNEDSLGYYDWSRTATHPYFPSANDFQQQGTKEDALSIVELPVGILQSKWVDAVFQLWMAVKRKSVARLWRLVRNNNLPSNPRTMTICAPPFLFNAMTRDILRRKEDWFVTYFHPDELLPDKGAFLNNMGYRLENFVKNIRYLCAQAERNNRKVIFMTSFEAAQILRV